METKISTKGQVVLPRPVRERLGLRPGDTLDVRTDGDAIVLRPRRGRRRKAKIIIDPISGFPALTAGKNAPKLTSEQVQALLTDFP